MARPPDGPSDAQDLLRAVGECAGADGLQAAGFEPMTVGFANVVCGAVLNGKPVVVKRYTDLVFLRLDAESIGVCDRAAGEAGLGPKVLHASAEGLVMERIPGAEVSEREMHQDDAELLEGVARALAALHQLPVPGPCAGEPMLWRTIDKMMDAVVLRPDLMPPGVPGVDALRGAVSDAKQALDQRAPRVVLCHGDFKPSNVMRDGSQTWIIDFELAGPNFSGFDLMKVFRTSLPTSQNSMLRFLRYYAEASGLPADEAAVCKMYQETMRFEPLTWLEAAVFFLAMPQFKPQETARWHALAEDRWLKWEETKGALLGARPPCAAAPAPAQTEAAP